MRRKARVRLIGILITMFIVGLACSSVLAAYPDKPIAVIVAYSAGGGTDLMTRVLFQAVEKKIGVPIIIENHAGASGQIGYHRLSKSKPDGYTLGCSNTGQLVMELTQKTEFKTKEDFTPLAQIVWDPYAIYVNSDSPFKTLDDLLEYAKANPGKTISWGGRTKWDAHYLTMAMLTAQTGVEFAYVPFDGVAETIAATLGGHITLSSGGVSEHVQLIKQGQIRALAVASEERDKMLPDVPTFRELGYEIITGATRGFSFPAGVPEEIVTQMVDVLRDVVENDEEFHDNAKRTGFYDILNFKGGDEYKQFIDDFFDSWKDTIIKMEPEALAQ